MVNPKNPDIVMVQHHLDIVWAGIGPDALACCDEDFWSGCSVVDHACSIDPEFHDTWRMLTDEEQKYFTDQKFWG